MAVSYFLRKSVRFSLSSGERAAGSMDSRPLEYRPIVAMTPPEPLGAEVRPAVVVPLIAQLRGEERELAERPLPLGVEQAMQPLARIADFFRILVDRVAHDSAFRKNSAIRPAT